MGADVIRPHHEIVAKSGFSLHRASEAQPAESTTPAVSGFHPPHPTRVRV